MYIGANQARVGGYSFVDLENNIKGSSQFVDNEEIIRLAKKHKIKYIYLAGDWGGLKRKGYGEKTTLADAKMLVSKQKDYNRNKRIAVSEAEATLKE